MAAFCDIRVVEELERLWDLAKELQLNPEEIKNDVYLLNDKNDKTAWHMAALWGKVEVLERLRDWVKELQLNAEGIK